jgi:hypothetical protein
MFSLMTRIFIFLSVLVVLGIRCSEKHSVAPICSDANDTQYLAFQLFVSSSTEPTGDNKGLSGFISPAKMEDFFSAVHSEVGTSAGACRKPAIMIGPIALDFSNADITNLIDQSFELAKRFDIAVGFHIDEGKFWANRPDLWKNPDNVEWIDWKRTPNTSSYVPWVAARLAPLMCFNAPLLKIAVNDFMSNIATAIKSNLNQLVHSKKEYLYAGTIVGWEPGIYPDRDTKMVSGYHALSNKGFGAGNLPVDTDQERVKILHEYMEWMSEPFGALGLPINKTYSHTVFLPRNYYDSLVSINPDFGKRSYAEVNNFSLPEVALGNGYTPGFSTYPLTGVLEEIHDLVNNSRWASAEGTDIIPEMPPVPSGYGMESYLARHYNYGCRLVTIFAFHLRGDPFTEALNDISEGPKAIAAYKKFLSGVRLIE